MLPHVLQFAPFSWLFSSIFGCPNRGCGLCCHPVIHCTLEVTRLLACVVLHFPATCLPATASVFTHTQLDTEGLAPSVCVLVCVGLVSLYVPKCPCNYRKVREVLRKEDILLVCHHFKGIISGCMCLELKLAAGYNNTNHFRSGYPGFGFRLNFKSSTSGLKRPVYSTRTACLMDDWPLETPSLCLQLSKTVDPTRRAIIGQLCGVEEGVLSLSHFLWLSFSL